MSQFVWGTKGRRFKSGRSDHLNRFYPGLSGISAWIAQVRTKRKDRRPVAQCGTETPTKTPTGVIDSFRPIPCLALAHLFPFCSFAIMPASLEAIVAKEKLWTMGNRVPSEFVTELEMARRKAEQHRKATPEAWQDYVALRKLVNEAVGKLLVLEDERADFTRRLTIDSPPADMKPEDADALCQDAVAGSLAHIAMDAGRKGWRDGAVYRAMVAYGQYMLAFERKTMGVQPEKVWGPIEGRQDADGPETLPPFGTPMNNPGTESI